MSLRGVKDKKTGLDIKSVALGFSTRGKYCSLRTRIEFKKRECLHKS